MTGSGRGFIFAVYVSAEAYWSTSIGMRKKDFLDDEDKAKVAHLALTEEDMKIAEAKAEAKTSAQSQPHAKKQKKESKSADPDNFADFLESTSDGEPEEIFYTNVDFIPASSASVERVFSKAGKLLS
ncbi:hypothetical protein Poli38472_003437 [Pythium oligandrum]|uniref:Uncharacterized protein n=1 Tax=Pythium oligandrum TaxID=41045 RepID=A0A8K1FFB9_PYTOL|nr:hypothetical protein Poli38472_003437 [Pythium oligandrum]|eukprot:TMW57512.1 hypothetical protein Poli38472_003437 [Pythium oligandrum]